MNATGSELAATIGNLKKFTSRRLLAQIEQERRGWLVQQLGFFRAGHKTHKALFCPREGAAARPPPRASCPPGGKATASSQRRRWGAGRWAAPPRLHPLSGRMPSTAGGTPRPTRGRGTVRSQTGVWNEGEGRRCSASA